MKRLDDNSDDGVKEKNKNIKEFFIHVHGQDGVKFTHVFFILQLIKPATLLNLISIANFMCPRYPCRWESISSGHQTQANKIKCSCELIFTSHFTTIFMLLTCFDSPFSFVLCFLSPTRGRRGL